MEWVTRHHVKVDRVACPWLIARFIDKQAQFLFAMTGEDPRIMFLHHWGVGRTEDLAKTIKAALDKTRHQPPSA
jgi:hypothetical protein